GMWFVAGVDDRPGACGGRTGGLPEVVGALAEAVLRAAGGEADVTGTGEDLPGDQERDEHIGHPGKVPAALDEVVLVAAVGVAGRVEVVLEQVDAPVDAVGGEPFLGVLEQALQDALTCLVL